MKNKKFIILISAGMLLASCTGLNDGEKSSSSVNSSEPVASSEVINSSESTPAETSEEQPVESPQEPVPAETSEEPVPAETSEEPVPVETSEDPVPVETSEELPAETSEEVIESSEESIESSEELISSEGEGDEDYVELGPNESAIITTKDKIEIGIGEENAFNTLKSGAIIAVRSSDKALAKYSLKVSTGYEEIVAVDGYNIIGLSEGDFKVQAICGKIKKVFNGRIVSDEKISLNRAFGLLEEGSYSYDSEIFDGEENDWVYFLNGVNNPTYKATRSGGTYVNGKDETDGIKLNYEGVITREGLHYGFTYNNLAQVDESDNLIIDDTVLDFNISSGYTYSPRSRGYSDTIYSSNGLSSLIDIVPSEFTDRSGNRYFELPAVEIDDYGTFNLDIFLGGIAGFSDPWYYVDYYAEESFGTNATKLVMRYDEENNELIMHAADDYNDETGFNLNFKLLGEAQIQEVEDWLDHGEVPELIDSSKINLFFDKLYESKTFTLNSEAVWYDSSFEPIATPSSWKTRTGVALKGQYSSTSFFNEDSVVGVVNSVDKDLYSLTNTMNDPNYAWTRNSYAAHDVNVMTAHNGSLYAADGKLSENDSVTWDGTARLLETQATSPWQTYSTPVPLSGKEDDEGNVSYLFDRIASLTSSTYDEEEKVTTYTLNCAGVEADDYYAEQQLHFSTLLGLLGDRFSFGYDITWFDEAYDYLTGDTMVASINDDLTELEISIIFSSSSNYFINTYSFTDIGEDKASALLTDLKFGDEPIESSVEPIESSEELPVESSEEVVPSEELSVESSEEVVPSEELPVESSEEPTPIESSEELTSSEDNSTELLLNRINGITLFK